MTDTRFEQRQQQPPKIDSRSLWTGGAATAVVAALVAVVCALVVRGVFDVPVIAPGNADSVIDYVGATWLAMFAVLGSLLATAVAHVLLRLAPRPMAFFGWIEGLVTLAFVIWPYTVHVGEAVQFANAALYLAIGTAIRILVTFAAKQAVQPFPRD
ncbi:DUF6069 family protein [Amycolatopsis sp. NBC_01488]|uniref:DUF6069 family protein n=1 Tax=Amycolatopsis sp. NBC_01488 TaxID=2903563 RepID=UPI002E2D817A|nr:DUF6069 family protein [Amycolatopsis sp. NBC_01488]